MPDLHFAGHAMSLGFDRLATVPGLSTQTAPLRILTQPRGSIQLRPEAEVHTKSEPQVWSYFAQMIHCIHSASYNKYAIIQTESAQQWI